MRIFGTSCLCGVGDEIINYDRVDALCVLLCHQIMDQLQHWPIERSGVVEAGNIALDPAFNAMYVPEGCTGSEPTTLLSATSTHDGHVFYQRKGFTMMWVAGDLRIIH